MLHGYPIDGVVLTTGCAPAPPGVPGATRQPFVADPYTSPRGMSAIPGNDVPIMCVTSPKGGAGKTTVTLNLGVALARRGKRVVVIDADHNGILLALNSKEKSSVGAYDVMAGRTSVADSIIQTRIPELRILASGEAPPEATVTRDGWKRVMAQASSAADFVLVDVAAGMYGPTADACAACTHALVVVPAEPLALRGLAGHLQRIEALSATPPKSVGVVLNMLDYRARASLDVLKELCTGPEGAWVFVVPIARSAAFMEAMARAAFRSAGGERTGHAVGRVGLRDARQRHSRATRCWIARDG